LRRGGSSPGIQEMSRMKRSKVRPVLFTIALVGALAGALLLGGQRSGAQESEPEAGITKTWALAECGKPLYAEGVEHFPYVNPDAPKGGSITLGEYGAFNTLNPLPPAGEEWPSAIGLISSSR
jgi:microcin C transport system substrate-binding protein